jgi:streptomycin 6-kinase
VESIPPLLAHNVVGAWGDAGRAFLDQLPELLPVVLREWQLTVEGPYPMSLHWVASVSRADGTPAVLKLGPTGLPDLADEVTALRHYDGAGAVRLLAHDVSYGAVLLEKAVPGTAASAVTADRDLVATAALITVMRRLHRPAADDVALPDLVARNRGSFVDHLARYSGDEPFPRRLVSTALSVLTELAEAPTERVVLHGDLHHDNVLRADREPWLAIDPHGVLGDRGAEVGAMLYNPDPSRRDPALVALVPARVEQLADGLGLPIDQVVAWGFVQAVLSEVWTAQERGAATTRALDVALALEPRLP